MTPEYVELHARSAFSFLRGAALPEHLAEQAASLDLSSIALCDRDGVYGAPRLHGAAKKHGIKAIVGAELTLDDASVLPVLVANRTGYHNLCRLITRAKLRGSKHHAPIAWDELAEFSSGLVALTGDEEGPIRRLLERDDHSGASACLQKLTEAFGAENVFVEVQRHLRRGEELINNHLFSLADAAKVPLLATNGVLYAAPNQRNILDLFTCTRHHTHLDAAGRLLALNSERYLKPADRMAKLFAQRKDALQNTVKLAERLEFSLENLGYEFPKYPVPERENMDTFLRKVTMAGARARYSHLSYRVLKQINHELDLITKLGFSGYFLIVWDLVNYCTEQNILVQGRGSAANSVVCYSLGITACDPISCNLLFERFLSEGRTSWPDIDLDLPSGDRRERVIQEVYRRYGPDGAAMTANVITFKGRSAMREIGKALNFSPDVLTRFSRLFGSGDFPHTLDLENQLTQAGIPIEHPRTKAACHLYQQLYGMPRHLGQHSGGMIICQGKLTSIVPLENASMPGRVVAQWDKDDCDDLGIIKVDLLGLGMMAGMQDALELCAARGHPVDLASIPKNDDATYNLLCDADTIGTFQVESRAQMATLPRMKPRCFYDIVVEVAIIRPGPIQGEMLHPYLARREGKEPVTYYDERLRPVLERTLGVPLFQEQLLKMAMVMADFSGGEAEELRRALSFHRSQEKMNNVCVKLRAGMERNGVAPYVIEKITKAVQSFAVYGFPESHAISFALIAYASCWMKVHRPEEFYAGLLNNQPMGFYSPDTLIKDAKRRGVRILPVSVSESSWFCTLPPRIDSNSNENPLRLGFCFVKGLTRQEGQRILDAAPFSSLADFQLRTRLSQSSMRTLAKLGALNALSEHRREAQWQVEVVRSPDDLFSTIPETESLPLLPMNLRERTNADYAGSGVTVGPHPMAHVRNTLPNAWTAAELSQAKTGTRLQIAGLVICRQRPGTAKGFVFISLEDETGVANAIVTPQLFERHRLLISEEPFLTIEGIVQNIDRVIHVKAAVINPLQLGSLSVPASHDFH